MAEPVTAPVSGPYRLGALGPRDLPVWWPKVVPLVQKWLAASHGEYALTDIYDGIAARDIQLWMALRDPEDPVVMALTERYRQGRIETVHVRGVAAADGENMDDWVPLLVEIERWARHTGATRLTGAGRPGWDRVMAHHGFKRLYSVIGKDLE